MARFPIFPILAGFVLVSRLAAGSPFDEDVLAVQQAMKLAKDHLILGDAQKAVAVLEADLAKANGNARYLGLLRDAYRAYIRDLWLANQSQAAKRYLQRLCILEPGAANDPALRGPAQVIEKKTPAAPAPVAPPADLPNYAKNNLKSQTVRGKADDPFKNEDPFALSNQRLVPKESETKQALAWLRLADVEFQKKRYGEARVLYEKAYQSDKDSLTKCKERWAYCLLNNVVEQVNQRSPTRDSLAGLEQQVKGAVAMAPGLETTGRWLLGEIEKRHKNQVEPEGQVTIEVRHLGRNPEGWEVAETPHFLIFHNQAKGLIEKVASVAEGTRAEMLRKWFGKDNEAWTPKCELILHASGTDYTRMTGVPGESPGHTRIESDPSGQRVVGRRIDLRCDIATMVEAVLPHETTHAVLAGHFGKHQVPRWADEGMAVLSEPKEKVDQHRRNLTKVGQDRGLFGLKQLMEMQDYPKAPTQARMQAFYAQSVCLTDFLTRERGPTVFTAFVRDGLNEGYEAALRRHYESDFDTLERRWQQFTTGQKQGGQ